MTPQKEAREPRKSQRCEHWDYEPLYFGVYGSLLGGSSHCIYDARPGSKFCWEHRNDEDVKESARG